jgi:hypothetical protein
MLQRYKDAYARRRAENQEKSMPAEFAVKWTCAGAQMPLDQRRRRQRPNPAATIAMIVQVTADARRFLFARLASSDAERVVCHLAEPHAFVRDPTRVSPRVNPHTDHTAGRRGPCR